MHARSLVVPAVAIVVVAGYSLQAQAPRKAAPATSPASFDHVIDRHSATMLGEGRQIFRYDTFGSEAFWGDALRLHEAIIGLSLGGVGAGVTPRQALQLGLKVDATALPAAVVAGIKNGTVSLDKPETTVELLKLNAVLGVTGIFDKDKQKIRSMGIQCALCHSTVDDSFSAGIGRRLDGGPNRDLNVGAIVAIAPSLKPFVDLLGVDDATVRTVLKSWGPGKYDAELDQDGKAMRPDGKSAATLLPAAFGPAGVNLHTYTGWGSVPYWNAYVANTQMHGQGTFFDPRLKNSQQFPVAVKGSFHDMRASLTSSPPSWRRCITISFRSRHRSLRPGRSTLPPPPAAGRSSRARRDARAATFRRCSPSRGGPCTRPRRWASTTSRRTGRPTNGTERRRCWGFSRA